MTPRGVTTVAGALGAIWALGVVWVGATQINLPIFSLTPVLFGRVSWPGLVSGPDDSADGSAQIHDSRAA